MSHLFKEDKILRFKRIEEILNLNPIRSLTEEKKEAINLFRNKYIYEILRLVPFNWESEPTYYILNIRSNTGKLFLLGYNLLKDAGEGYNLCLLVGAALEIFSANSLILDDIIDNDVTRQGLEAAHIRYGIQRSLLSIEYTNNLILNKLRRESTFYSNMIEKSWDEKLESFTIELLMKTGKITLSRKNYEELARKIGAFAVQLGKYLYRKYPDRKRYYLKKFLEYSTIAWVFDDPLLIFRDSTSKAYSDIRNGYYTLPVVLLLKKLKSNDLKLFRKNFGKEGKERTIYMLFKKYDIEEECMKIVKKYHSMACRYLDKIFKEFDYETKLVLIWQSFVSKANLKYGGGSEEK
jgi:geranylgeranyl pyrophosphate synthase